MKGAGFRCEVHADQEAVGYCCKCGAFLCEECAITTQDPLIYCASCYEKFVGPVPIRAPLLPEQDDEVAEGAVEEEATVEPTTLLKGAAYRVEVHFQDGAIKQGSTYSIRPDKGGFFIVPLSQVQKGVEETQEFIPFAKIKAVYLLKTSTDSEHASRETEFIPEGHEITVEFKDGDVLEGFALGEYDPLLPRFHVIPRDEKSSAFVSVLVERASVERIQLGMVFRAKELRQLMLGPVRKLLLCCYIDNVGAVADIDAIATAIGRTPRIVDREIGIFLSEGLMKELEGPPNRKIQFLPPADIQTINFLSEHDQELHEFYMRQQRLGL